MLSDQANESPESPQAATSSTTQQSVIVPCSGLPPFPSLDPLSNPTNTGLTGRKWLGRFENLLISLRETGPTVKRGLLLTYVGETMNDIFDTLPSTGTDYDSAVQSLTKYFDPAINKDMEIYEFRPITQASGETLNEFYRHMRIH